MRRSQTQVLVLLQSQAKVFSSLVQAEVCQMNQALSWSSVVMATAVKKCSQAMVKIVVKPSQIEPRNGRALMNKSRHNFYQVNSKVGQVWSSLGPCGLIEPMVRQV